MRFRTLQLVGLICALAACFAPAAAAAPATFSGASADGKAVFFTTTDKLVPGDTDTRVDVYVRAYDTTLGHHVTRPVSVGPIGGNDAHHASFVGVSAGGTKAFFATDEKLVAGDQDVNRQDIYVRDLSANTTALVSDDDPDCTSGCPDGDFSASFAPGGLALNAERIFFRTAEQLSPGDKDSSFDVYVRDLVAGTTALVSAGSAGCAGEGCGNGAFSPEFRGASSDGAFAFFVTDEKLVTADGDGSLLDVYRRDLASGVTDLISVSGVCPSLADCNASYGGVSADGSHAYFETAERLAGQDEDSAQDVYDWTTGGVALVSTRPGGGNGTDSATYKGVSFDGTRVFFGTSESLDAADTDDANDLYERAGGTTSLVSIGPAGGNAEISASFLWVSPDGSSEAVFFTTEEKLTSADTDAFQDVYSREGGTTTLLSAGGGSGNGPFDAGFVGASSDGSHLFVLTEEKLAVADDDSAADVYEIVAGAITLVSTGPLASTSSAPAALPNGAVAKDGSHAFFTTEQRLTEGDLDAETDVYDHFSGGTLLASTGNFVPLGPPTPSQLSTDPGSPGESLTPRIKGQSDPGTSIKIYATSDCSGVPIATGTQAELGGSGIQVTVGESSTTSFRATATDANGDISPCSAAVSYTHQPATQPPPPPPPPPPGEEGGSGGTGTTGGSTGSTGSGGGSRGGGGKGVVYVTPQTRITFAPASKTRARRPVFRFTDSTGQDGTSFKCKLDRGRWRGCSSPVKLKKLKLGRHVFRVKAVNAVGVPEPTATKRAFKVVGG
ncbi:MAG TPA: hypothetical protein VFT79_13600 [Solirubrobacterales bacterium]|nr:hypothetical protein [Solirubrobacterales bacterium]